MYDWFIHAARSIRHFGMAMLLSVLLSSFGSAQSPGIEQQAPASGPFVEIPEGYMVPYDVTIPGTSVTFTMIPVPGGRFLMGSPDSESGRHADEGPQVAMELEPFWMAKNEVSWAEYQLFMGMYKIFKQHQSRGVHRVDPGNLVDAITVPTPLYAPDHTYLYGENVKHPAVTMTQLAAKQYSKWLSSITQQQFRLPCEAEWEYAARAGSSGAYCFGDDPKELASYAYFAETAENGPGLVGERAPNAFGLHDMHGNVWEWTIDGYSVEGHHNIAKQVQAHEPPIQWPQHAFPRTVRGGGWQDPADRLRSASRMGSADEEWKDIDPCIPLSPWWYTSDPARSIGFRLVRSYQPLDLATIKRYWDLDHDDIHADVQMQLNEGRGAQGIVVPAIIKELEKLK